MTEITRPTELTCLLCGPLQKKHMLTSGQESLQMCQGFRILAPGRALTGANQCVYLLRNGLPLI